MPIPAAPQPRRLAGAAAELFADDPDVDVLHGDWREVLAAYAPFDLIFVDGGRAKDDPDTVLALAAPGTTIVLDDFSADGRWPDPRRESWLAHPRLAAVEIGTRQAAQVIVAVVRR